ncbi:MAG: carbohydrate binding family 9 domain-containing protein, partial [Proteobacteria bacterium]|nr:carbohydrate binding family 9 domain-containing protein [Pseudomonadota bacterium]
MFNMMCPLTKIIRHFLPLLVGTATLCFCGVSIAQESTDIASRTGQNKVLQMVRTSTPPVIDGVMDEIWKTAAIVDDLHQIEPIEYATPSEKTVIRVLYDENFLYVSGMMYYSDPSTIAATKMIQGASPRYEDKLRVYINPFNDGRNGYLFQSTPYGVRSESIFENVRGNNFDWTGIWYAGTQFTDYGWFAEIAIPFKTISFDPNSSDWGISFARGIEKKTEDLAWTSYNRSTNPSNFGTATGFSDIKQGMGLDLIPGLSISESRAYGLDPNEPDSSETNFEPTLDAFYKITPNLTGALTFNSDFSATEVDNRQIQLTRFNLFFPEQRK